MPRPTRWTLLLTAALVCSPLAPCQRQDTAALLAAWLPKQLPSLVALYRELHQQPELSFHEEATAERFATALERQGLAVTRRFGGHGVVGVLENGEGPTLMLRADLDGLPIAEQTGLEFASKVRVTGSGGVEQPVMHACGHDVHMTNLIGAVRFLAQHREAWSGRLLCIGQPAEERGGGAVLMLRKGLFRKFPKPDFALALHVHPMLPAGTVGFRAGFAMANVDSVDITVFGKGGHGAYPHLTVDPIVQASELVLSLQTVVSREIDPTEAAVITVGSIHSGAKHNIISDRCELQLTVRSYSASVRKALKDAIARKAKAVADAHRAPAPEVKFSEGVPALFNDHRLVERVVDAMREELGDDRVVPVDPIMGAEDFAYFHTGLGKDRGVPVFMFRLGTVAQQRIDAAKADGDPLPGLHSALYYPDAEPALRAGVRAMVAGVCRLLPR